ncbi:hypothetical protein PAEPH01_0336 [Pancytospora epiphaga]|nr:hypothetical protein PAEPH01_0336 [Pancytospora epiphaga]
MKSNFYKKLIRFAAAEVLMQLGFERTTEHALNIIADVATHYMESMILRIYPFQSSPTENVIDMLIRAFYGFEQYQKDELVSFLEQQLQVRRQMRDKPEDNVLQHALRSLPMESTRSHSLRMINTTAVEERARPRILEEMIMDGFLSEYIERCNQIETRPSVMKNYRYDTSVQIVSSLDLKNEEGVRCDVGTFSTGRGEDALASQELFLEDFPSKEKYKVFKLSSS